MADNETSLELNEYDYVRHHNIQPTRRVSGESNDYMAIPSNQESHVYASLQMTSDPERPSWFKKHKSCIVAVVTIVVILLVILLIGGVFILGWYSHGQHLLTASPVEGITDQMTTDKRTPQMTTDQRIHQMTTDKTIHQMTTEATITQVSPPCSRDNGGSSHSCLIDPVTERHKCACPFGLRLLADDKTCVKTSDSEEILLLACDTELRLIHLETPDYTDVVLQVENFSGARGIDYDPVDNKVYWTDVKSDTIQCAHLDGTNQVVINTELYWPVGVAVDWIARNLYWTDSGKDKIEVSRLEGTSRRVLISEDLDKPHALVLDPKKGYMYWTDVGNPAKIERANLDGSDRLVLVNSDIWWPWGLALDIPEQKLYWGDIRNTIEVINTDGTGRKVVLEDKSHSIWGLSVLGDYLYWTGFNTVHRAEKRAGTGKELIAHLACITLGLKAVKTHQAEGTNGCYVTNGGCSHLCLHRPDYLGFICACPMHMQLLADGKTCEMLKLE